MICLRLSRVHNATSKIVTREELQEQAYNFVRISGKRGVSAYYSMFGNYVGYGISLGRISFTNCWHNSDVNSEET